MVSRELKAWCGGPDITVAPGWVRFLQLGQAQLALDRTMNCSQRCTVLVDSGQTCIALHAHRCHSLSAK